MTSVDPYPPLLDNDPSRGKLVELQERLLNLTHAGRLAWSSAGGQPPVYELALPSGQIEVSLRGIRIWDDDGREQRAFSPLGTGLYTAIEHHHLRAVDEIVEKLMADLNESSFAHWRETPHEFVGRHDRDCQRCGLADRARVHSTAERDE